MNYCLSVTLQNNLDASIFTITGVYGPSTRTNRDNFYKELTDSKPMNGIPWILGGDFNATITPEDRTDNSNDWRNMMAFATLTSSLGLLNLSLQGRQFTWLNEREQPHMARLDRFLISADWNVKFPNSVQKALPNTSSDHCPITYTSTTEFRKTKFFRFENFWLRSEKFRQMVNEKWKAMPEATTPNQLQNKLTDLKEEIKRWTATKEGTIKTQIRFCRDYLGWLDKVKEMRPTTRLERLAQSLLKKRYTELSVLEEDIFGGNGPKINGSWKEIEAPGTFTTLH